MQKRKSKKINKLRGQRSAGYGFTKGHRAAGQRGGKGMAGSKKHHYIKIMIENPRYFGKWGFKRPQKLLDTPVVLNIGEIDEAADRLVEKGIATMTGKRYNIDVSRLGIDRILGSGKVTRKLNLTGVQSITPRAREKVTGIGGTIDLPAE
ncbi:50S ribosomal protein L15 [Candidatus Thorarchaeota archaeon]|nr:MAG: 50S ribosomal protein L15 [Candidatus Thorarchaeota archaeon]